MARTTNRTRRGLQAAARRPRQSAAAALHEAQTRIRLALAALDESLLQLGDADPNWGLVGDAKHAAQLLEQAVPMFDAECDAGGSEASRARALERIAELAQRNYLRGARKNVARGFARRQEG